MKKVLLTTLASLFLIPLCYAQWSTSGTVVYYNGGDVGIGTSSTSALLHVYCSSNVQMLKLQNTLSTSYSQISFIGTGKQYQSGVGNASESTRGVANAWYVYDANSEAMRMVITSGGSVLIGQSLNTTGLNLSYMLNVGGTARMSAITVNSTGADFVFEPKYQLMPLTDLGEYLSRNHHLPGIAPAEQMRAEGLNLGENQTMLLQKVEELTLYLIEKDKQMTAESEQLAEEKQKSEEQEERIKKLEAQMERLIKAKQ